jgi:predicted DNA-binding transcriptional regulator AlpA
MEKKLLTEKEAALYITMSRSFLRQDRMNGLRKNRMRGPKPIRLGRSVRYLREELDRWLNMQMNNIEWEEKLL